MEYNDSTSQWAETDDNDIQNISEQDVIGWDSAQNPVALDTQWEWPLSSNDVPAASIPSPVIESYGTCFGSVRIFISYCDGNKATK